MSAALLQLKELAVLLCDTTPNLPRPHRWQQPWATACRALLERNIRDQNASRLVACRISAYSLTTDLLPYNLYFAPNGSLADFVTDTQSIPLDDAVQMRHLHASPNDGSLASPTRALKHQFTPFPILNNRHRYIPLHSSPHVYLRVRPTDLATFSSDARRLAEADHPPDPDAAARNSPTSATSEDATMKVPRQGALPSAKSNGSGQPLASPRDLPRHGDVPQAHISSAASPQDEDDDRFVRPLTGNSMFSMASVEGGSRQSPAEEFTDFPDAESPFGETSPPADGGRPQNPDKPLSPAFQTFLSLTSPAARLRVRGGAVLKEGRTTGRARPQTKFEVINKNRAARSAALWEVWDQAVREGWADGISVDRQFSLAQALESFRPEHDTPEERRVRGERLKKVLDRIEGQAGQFDAFRNPASLRRHMQCFRVYQHDLLGDWPAVQKSLPEVLSEPLQRVPRYEARYSAHLVNLVRYVLIDAQRYDSPMRALDILLDNFVVLEPVARRWETEVDQVKRQWRFQSRAIQMTVDQAISSIPQPVEWFEDHEATWDPARRRRISRLFLESYIRQDNSEVAFAIWSYMQRADLHVPHPTRDHLATFLAVRESLVEAKEVFERSMEIYQMQWPGKRWPERTIKTALIIAAHAGDVNEAEAHYETLSKSKRRSIFGTVVSRLTVGDHALRLHAYAVAGRIDDMLKLWEEMFPSKFGIRSGRRPGFAHFVPMILGHARQGDLDSANKWLSNMVKSGFTPNTYVYNIVLRPLAKRLDVDAVRAILEQMQKTGISRDSVTYVCIMNMYATMRDPVNAEKTFQKAMKDGITPTRQLFNRLVNAHVEAASWPGVIRAFDFVMNLPYRTLRLSIDLCNILLKAYVLIGAPHYTVRGVFTKLEEFGAIPNFQSWCLVIQSAVDTKHIKVANRLFREMQTALKLEPSNPSNVYPLSILIAGHLRRAETEEARLLYNEMVENKIQPSIKTFSAIIRSHAVTHSRDNLYIAERFLKEVLENPGEKNAYTTPTTPETRLEFLFMPLMVAHAKTHNSRQVERLYAEFLEKGGTSNLNTLSVLLLAYSRIGDTDAVVQVWEEIHQLGLQLLNHKPVFPEQDAEDPKSSHGGTHATWLAPALTMYIIALSTAGRHTPIAETLAQLRTEGFTFDASNWNNIAVAMMRAGEPERAFEVLERVILRYQAESERVIRQRDVHPKTPLMFSKPDEEGELKPIPYKAQGAKRRGFLARSNEAAVPKPGWDIMGEDQMEAVEDLIHSLHVLHQVSPAWQIWRPYPYMLRVLGKFLTGRLTADDGIDLGLSAAGPSQELLQRIYTNYPAAVSAVLANERRLQWKRRVQD